MSDSFEITVPVLNEDSTLAQNIEKLMAYLSDRYSGQARWSVVIADNGSTDRTEELSREMVTKYNGLLKYIRLEEKGVGRALKASWGRSKADVVGYFDLDLATDLSHVPKALSAIVDGHFDIVCGTRLHDDSEVIGRSLKREIASKAFNLILKQYLKINFTDGMCGFKFLRRNILDGLIERGAISDGWFFSTELLTVAEKSGFRIMELPIRWTDSQNSKVSIIPLAVQYLKEMGALKRRLRSYE